MEVFLKAAFLFVQFYCNGLGKTLLSWQFQTLKRSYIVKHTSLKLSHGFPLWSASTQKGLSLLTRPMMPGGSSVDDLRMFLMIIQILTIGANSYQSRPMVYI